MSLASVTIAIPTFNRATQLRLTLASVLGLAIPEGLRCELLVVDNASTDGTQAVVSTAAIDAPFPIRAVIESQSGLCHARNRALAEARGEHVVFFDDDIRIAPGWLKGCVDAVRSGADCVVGPVTPVFPSPLPDYATASVLALIGSDYSRKGSVAMELPPETAGEIPGCNFAVRRTMALEVGSFDAAFGRVGKGMMAGEDFEFGLRLVKARGRVFYEPRCAIEHLIDPVKLTQPHLRSRAAGLGRTEARMREKHHRSSTFRETLKSVRRTAGCWFRWRWRALKGDAVGAFEWELRARRKFAELLPGA